ncbi:MAG: hypothetical protein R2699_15070 [Acidimicrobiales bacterium]
MNSPRHTLATPHTPMKAPMAVIVAMMCTVHGVDRLTQYTGADAQEIIGKNAVFGMSAPGAAYPCPRIIRYRSPS